MLFRSKGLDKFRASMFADKRISKIFDFIDSRDCFSNVDIAGGICYFLWDKSNESDCNFTTVKGSERTFSIRNLSSMSEFIRHAEAAEIVEKIKSFSSIFLDTVVSTQKPFGLRTYVTPMKTGSLTLKFNKGKGPYEDNAIEIGREMIPQWKNIISCLTAEHAGQTDKEGRKKILSSLDILAPNEICTETYMVIGHFDTELECQNMDKYARTLLFRFLVSQQIGRASCRERV